MAEHINLRSMNVRGLHGTDKRNLVFNHLSNYKNDLLLLQDTHTDFSQEKIWKNKWGQSIFFNHGDSNSRGLCTIIPKSLEVKSEMYFSDNNGRILTVKLTFAKCIYYIINVYAPVGSKHSEQLKFLDSLNTHLSELKDLNIIMGGDWNTVLNFEMDRKGGSDNLRHSKYSDNLKILMEEFDLSDCWRLLHPNKRKYTWRKDNYTIHSRLDMWLISSNLLNILSKTIIEPGFRTDHSMIKLSLKMMNFKRGRGVWKFNNTLLHDTTYVTFVKDLLGQETQTIQTYTDKGFAWDYVKMRLRTETMEYTSIKNKEKKKHVDKLLKRLDELDERIPRENSEDLMDERTGISRELECINTEKLQGSIFRSKCDWTEFGEQNNKYFLNLEKYNSSNKSISNIIVEGKDVTDQKLVNTEIKKYYENLYSQNTTDHKKLDEILKDIPKLDKEDMEKTQGQISYKECLKALKGLQNGKTPGIDGITTDFYKFFWNDINVILLESINFAFTSGEMSGDQKMGIITLSPKKDKVRHYLKNWRPITLLTVDYKLIAKTMALRLEKIMPKYINETQFGYVKGRYIGENIRCVIDINDVCNKKGINAYAIQIDFEKAFDSVNWDFMLISLEKMNFSPDFIKWVKVMYTNCKSLVVNNGHLTESFNLKRGVHQGCPLSALLFIILVQVLQHMLKKRKDISGITINGKEIKILQMADDTTLFTRNIKDVEKIMRLLKLFHIISGLKTNVDKTIAYILGDNNAIKQNDRKYNLLWKKLPISLLGIQITNDQEESYTNNFEKKLESIDTLTKIWATRNLSLKGKTTIVNTLLIPKLIYPCTILDVPPAVITKANSIIMNFVWNWKTPKIKKDYLVRKVDQGGIKLPCLECKIKSWKTIWAIRCLKNYDKDPLWTSIVTALLPCGIDLKYLLICNPERKYLVDYCPLLPKFYMDIIMDWTILNYDNEVNTKDKISNQCLWLNKNLTAGKNPLFCKVSINKIKTIHDLLDDNHEFKDLHTLNTEYKLKWTFLDYMRIRQTIPTKWREILKGLTNVTVIKNQQLAKLKKLDTLKSKDIYWMLLPKDHDLSIIANPIQYWMTKYKLSLDSMKTLYTLPYVSTKATYIQSLQYKILYKITNCNHWLNKIKILDSAKCRFCTQIETVEHFFFGCKSTKMFWKSVLNWWNNLKLMLVKELQENSIILGMMWSDHIGKVLNCCILVGKLVIYKNKNKNIQPTLYHFLSELKSYILIDESISIKNNKLSTFESEWGEILSLI